MEQFMVDSKKSSLIDRVILVFWCLVFIILVGGNIFRISFQIHNFTFEFLLLDVVASFGLVLALITRRIKYLLVSNSGAFCVVALFTLIVSSVVYTHTNSSLIIGILYLIRLIVYLSLSTLIDRSNVSKLLHYAQLSLICSAILGLLQYFYIPDLRYLKNFGWDDHLYRLVGTYLDPTYTGILFVVGIFISIGLLYSRKWLSVVCICVLSVSTIFTYSRASYTALVIGILFMLWRKYHNVWAKVTVLTMVILAMISIVLLLPRPEGEGVRLERINSITQRFQNYAETIAVAKTSPLLGVGYNMMCSARDTLYGSGVSRSHSCSGSDASILFVLATTGIVGLIVFIYLLHSIWQISYLVDWQKAILIAVFVHSFFANTLFYPFVFILLCVSISARDSRSVGN
jgi:O-antigen ligase